MFVLHGLCDSERRVFEVSIRAFNAANASGNAAKES